MVSAENLLKYTGGINPFTLHIDASDKQLGDVISQNDKTIALFLRKVSNPQHNYTTIEKEIILILECLNKLYGIIFG